MISKTERLELRSIVRQQFKVLREEVTHRKTEVLADVEEEIASRYHDEDEAWEQATAAAYNVVADANRQVNEIFRNLLGQTHTEDQYVGWRPPRRDQQKKADLRKLATRKVDATVTGALLQLSRQEADLLRELAVGALESDEARGFLRSIPAAAQLVPLARLAELEAELGHDQDRFE